MFSVADITFFGEAFNLSVFRCDFLNKYVVYVDEMIGRYGIVKDGYCILSVCYMMYFI